MSRNSSFIRTDKAIMQAFIELLKEKPFEKITVQDILEQTPVTRATFYAHYHDKYEIAEKMQEQFFKLCDEVRLQLMDGVSGARHHQIVQKSYLANRELTKALLKIHTDKVDLRQIIVKEFEDYYIASSEHPVTLTEARIYAQARAELELAFAHDETEFFSFEQSNEMMLAVSLKLLRLDRDEEVRDFMHKKLTEKFKHEK